MSYNEKLFDLKLKGCVYDNFVNPAILFEKSVIFMCYSSERLIALSTLREVVASWYSFYS